MLKTNEEKRRAFSNLSEILPDIKVTDVDNCQLCIKINDRGYKYFQIKDIKRVPKIFLYQEVIDYYNNELLDNEHNSFNTEKLLLDFKNGKAEAIHIIDCSYFWFIEWEDLDEFDEYEIEDMLLNYYPKEEVEEMIKDIPSNLQLICEAFFEMSYSDYNED